MKRYLDIDIDGRILSAQTIMSGVEISGVVIPNDSPADDMIVESYWWDESLTLRLTMPVTVDKTTITADETDMATITGIPEDAEVFLNGVSQGTVTGGTLEVTSDVPKILALRFVLFPYLDTEVTINAT